MATVSLAEYGRDSAGLPREPDHKLYPEDKTVLFYETAAAVDTFSAVTSL